MDLVALSGFTDDSTLLKLSAANRQTVTIPVRHAARKRKVQVQRDVRYKHNQNRLKFAHDRFMAQQTLASIVMTPSLSYASNTALVELKRSIDRRICIHEVRRWAADHMRYQLADVVEELSEGSEEESEEEDEVVG
jgi:hypothetical protein